MASFICQRCKHPLRIDESLTDIDVALADMLTAPLVAEEQHVQQIRSANHHPKEASRLQKLIHEPISKRFVGVKPSETARGPSGRAGQLKRDTLPPPSESFVVLSRSQVTNPPFSGNGLQPTAAIPSTSSAALASAGTSPARVAGGALTSTSPISPSNAAEDDTWKASRNNSLSHRLKVAGRLFDIMSSKSSVDHPMCQECTDMLLEGLERQLDDVRRERDSYIDFLKNIKNSRVTEEEATELSRQVEELKLVEESAEKELQAVIKEQESKKQELEQLQQALERLKEQEDQYWEKCNKYQLNLQHFQNERDTINLKYDHDVKQYERLQKTVVYSDAFSISHDGPFGTINGFRLGRLSSHPVEWAEINAAWGQALLLLYTVANKLKIQFRTYRLVPMGSFSRVEKVDGDNVLSYELYGSGDFGLNRMFLNRRFDQAMVAILNCLKQLTDYAEERDKSLKFPYRINKDKIGELSIRLQFNQDELWTKALKYMLTDIKWILVFASRTNAAADANTGDE